MTEDSIIQNSLFEVSTPLGFTIRVSSSYWDLITTIKHPVMSGLEIKVQETLENPDEIRVSQSDSAVFLFHKNQRPNRWICAVAKRLDGVGFLITTYPTDSIKEGVQIWPK